MYVWPLCMQCLLKFSLYFQVLFSSCLDTTVSWWFKTYAGVRIRLLESNLCLVNRRCKLTKQLTVQCTHPIQMTRSISNIISIIYLWPRDNLDIFSINSEIKLNKVFWMESEMSSRTKKKKRTSKFSCLDINRWEFLFKELMHIYLCLTLTLGTNCPRVSCRIWTNLYGHLHRTAIGTHTQNLSLVDFAKCTMTESPIIKKTTT